MQRARGLVLAPFLCGFVGGKSFYRLTIPPAVIPFIPEAIYAMVAVWPVISVRAVHRSDINRCGSIVIPRPCIHRIGSSISTVNIKSWMRRRSSRSKKSQKPTERRSRQRRFPNNLFRLRKNRVHDLLPHSGPSSSIHSIKHLARQKVASVPSPSCLPIFRHDSWVEKSAADFSAALSITRTFISQCRS